MFLYSNQWNEKWFFVKSAQLRISYVNFYIFNNFTYENANYRNIENYDESLTSIRGFFFYFVTFQAHTTNYYICSIFLHFRFFFLHIFDLFFFLLVFLLLLSFTFYYSAELIELKVESRDWQTFKTKKTANFHFSWKQEKYERKKFWWKKKIQKKWCC